MSLVAVAAGIYLLLLALLWGFQRSLIYHPGTVRPVPEAFQAGDAEIVSINTTDGLKLMAWWFSPESPERPAIIYFHGNAGHIGYRAFSTKPYRDAGFGLLLMSWRGYAGNPGRPTEQGLYLDGNAALKWVRDTLPVGAPVILFGESLGTGVAVELASREKVSALVLQAPFSSLAAVAQSHYPVFPVKWLIKDQFHSDQKIGRIGTSLLIGHGARDRIVPLRFARRLFLSARDPKNMHVYPDAGHNDLPAHGWPADVVKFLKSIEKKDNP